MRANGGGSPASSKRKESLNGNQSNGGNKKEILIGRPHFRNVQERDMRTMKADNARESTFHGVNCTNKAIPEGKVVSKESTIPYREVPS
jgi:hypothetical protein